MALLSAIYNKVFNGDLLILSSFLTLLILSSFFYYLFYYKRVNPWYHQLITQTPLPSAIADNKNRKPGNWIPEDTKWPTPNPYPNWDVNTTSPIPYRAFKHGYNVTMGTRTEPLENWIEIDNEWDKFNEIKRQRMATEWGSQNLFKTLPEGGLAAKELLHELFEYLPKRYPSMFKLSNKTLVNSHTGEQWDFNSSLDPMFIIANIIQEDVAIMQENEKGEYVFKSGAIIIPGSWRLKDKINMTLEEIHNSGKVPKYESNLQRGMDNFFKRLNTTSLAVRNNFMFQIDDGLGWSNSLGDELTGHLNWNSGDSKADNIDQVMYRSERQTLRRLPITGAIVFTIRTYFMPLVSIADEPYVPRRLFDALTAWTDDVREYKGFNKVEHLVMPFLDQKGKEQEAMGYTVENEVKNYPY